MLLALLVLKHTMLRPARRAVPGCIPVLAMMSMDRLKNDSSNDYEGGIEVVTEPSDKHGMC